MFNWIKRLFKKNDPRPATPPPVPEVVPPVTNLDPVPITQPPLDTVNDGTPARPDWSYLWDTCKIDSEAQRAVDKVCDTVVKNINKYKAIEAATKVPWKLIAAIHYREASLNFSTCLHNGDQLPGPTRRVPKGRGPFNSWEEAAIDALKYDGLHLIKLDTVVAQLVMAEKYNGLGYRKRGGEYSPYVWAGTNHSDETGKYVVDGKYDANAPEKQLGVAAILKGLESYE